MSSAPCFDFDRGPSGSRTPTVAVVAIGDELLAGVHPDLNSCQIARRMRALGLIVERFALVGDDEAGLAELFRELLAGHDLVLSSGGLGPTLDDVTRHAAARAADRALVRSESALEEVRVWFDRRGMEMPASNQRQALFPAGAEPIPNRMGTAPGFRLELGRRALVAMPGPPRELVPMLDDALVPWLRSVLPGEAGVAEVRLHLVNLSESAFAERVGSWMDRDRNPLMGVTAKGGVLSVHLTARASEQHGGAARARELLAERVGEFRERFAEHLFSDRDPDLERAVGAVLIERGITITVAESCTGGRVAWQLTRVPGISAVFEQGYVTYSDGAKQRLLGVDPELLGRCGAVSSEVAAAMAAGAARESGARLALAITGIAGPGGGSPEKPVGTVWFGLCIDGRTRTELRTFPEDWGREAIRGYTATSALGLLWTVLPEVGPGAEAGLDPAG